MEKIGEALIRKLTMSELSELCDAHDDGSLNTIFVKVLYPRDYQNNPEKYVPILKKIKK